MKNISLLLVLFLAFATHTTEGSKKISPKKIKTVTTDSISVVRYMPEKYFKSQDKMNVQYVVRFLIYSSERLNKKNIKLYVNEKQIDLQSTSEKRKSHWQHIDYYRSYFTYILTANDIETAYKTKLCVNTASLSKCSDLTSIENMNGRPQLNVIAFSANTNAILNNAAKQFKALFEPGTLIAKNEALRGVKVNATTAEDLSVLDINQLTDELIKNFKRNERPLKRDIMLFYLSARPYEYYQKKELTLFDYFTRGKYKNCFSINEITRKLAKLPCRSILITDVPKQEANNALNFQHKVTVLSYTAPKNQRNDGTTDQDATGKNYLNETIKTALTSAGDANNDGTINKNEFVEYLENHLKCGKKGKLITINHTENFNLINVR